MRQTNLTCEEILLSLAGQRECPYPRCLLLNELGVMAKEGDKEAEKALRPVLLFLSENERAVAYCCLAGLETYEPETIAALKLFANDAENASLIGWAHQQYGIVVPTGTAPTA